MGHGAGRGTNKTPLADHDKYSSTILQRSFGKNESLEPNLRSLAQQATTSSGELFGHSTGSNLPGILEKLNDLGNQSAKTSTAESPRIISKQRHDGPDVQNLGSTQVHFAPSDSRIHGGHVVYSGQLQPQSHGRQIVYHQPQTAPRGYAEQQQQQQQQQQQSFVYQAPPPQGFTYIQSTSQPQAPQYVHTASQELAQIAPQQGQAHVQYQTAQPAVYYHDPISGTMHLSNYHVPVTQTVQQPQIQPQIHHYQQQPHQVQHPQQHQQQVMYVQQPQPQSQQQLQQQQQQQQQQFGGTVAQGVQYISVQHSPQQSIYIPAKSQPLLAVHGERQQRKRTSAGPSTYRGHVSEARSSNFRGVSWHRRGRKWVARIWITGRSDHLGVFSSEYQAALAVDDKLAELGEDPITFNFPDPEERKRVEKMIKAGFKNDEELGGDTVPDERKGDQFTAKNASIKSPNTHEVKKKHSSKKRKFEVPDSTLKSQSATCI